MHVLLKTGVIIIGLAGVAFATACVEGPYSHDRRGANVDVRFGFGDVRDGYRDGYWDHQHRWNSWQHQDDAGRYRRVPQNRYHDWDHNRDPDQGWHNHDEPPR